MRDEDGTTTERSDAGRAGDAIAPIVAEALTRVVDILRTQGRSRLGDSARWTRRRLELHQSSKDIDALYSKLGRELVCLVEAGEVAHPGLVKRATRIRQEEARHEGACKAHESAAGADPAEE